VAGAEFEVESPLMQPVTPKHSRRAAPLQLKWYGLGLLDGRREPQGKTERQAPAIVLSAVPKPRLIAAIHKDNRATRANNRPSSAVPVTSSRCLGTALERSHTSGTPTMAHESRGWWGCSRGAGERVLGCDRPSQCCRGWARRPDLRDGEDL